MNYTVRGNYPAMQNGEVGYVIVDFPCKTKEEAEAVLEHRRHIYQKLHIIENNQTEK